MRFTLFKTPPHRTFNYIPRYYKPDKERREKGSGEYVPGKNIKSGMRRSMIESHKATDKYEKIRKIVILITIGILFLVAYLVIKYFNIIWQT